MNLDDARALKQGDVLSFGNDYTYVVQSVDLNHTSGVFVRLLRSDDYVTHAAAHDMKVGELVGSLMTKKEPENTSSGAVPAKEGRYQVQAYRQGENPLENEGVVAFADGDIDICKEFINEHGKEDRDYYIFDVKTGEFVGAESTEESAVETAQTDEEVSEVIDDKTTTSTPKSRKGK